MNVYTIVPFTDHKKMSSFCSKWSINASKLIQQYAKDHSLDWYNTKWKNKSKDIFFFIRTKAPKGSKGNIWFMSKPTNYAYDKSVGKLKASRKRIPKKVQIKPVHAYGRWFKPKTYQPPVDNINTSISNINTGSNRFFVSKTSHNKSRKYKKPMLWYQDNKGTVGPVNLKEQLADKIAEDPETYEIIMKAFNMTLEAFS